MDKAMNLTSGDLMIVEFALINYYKTIDVSMKSGEYIFGLIGRVEKNLAIIKKKEEKKGPAEDPIKTDNIDIAITYGDFVLIELAIQESCQDITPSMELGELISRTLGKIEYGMARMENADEEPKA